MSVKQENRRSLNYSLLIVICSLLIVNCENPYYIQILKPITAAFDTNGGSRIASQTILKDQPVQRPPNPAKAAFIFENWYIDNTTFLEPWNFNTIPTTDITLYANWTPVVLGPGTLIVTITIEQITNPSFPIMSNITISRTGAGYSTTAILSVTETDYDLNSVNWTITGVGFYSGQTFTTQGGAITLDATDQRYNSTGTHTLVLEVRIDGMTYRRNITFTITI